MEGKGWGWGLLLLLDVSWCFFFFFLIISLVGHFLGEGGGLFICKVFSSVALFLL